MPWLYMPFHTICHGVKRVSGKNDEHKHLKAIGSAICAQRKLMKLSQEALAHNAGIDRSHMGRIERGERNLTLLNLIRVAEALDQKPSVILNYSGL